MAGVKGACGGARTGAGRKSIAEEFKTSDLARKAIIEKYGSLEDGLKALMNTGEQALIKFVFEHALGKPNEKIVHEIETVKTFTIIAASSSKRD